MIGFNNSKIMSGVVFENKCSWCDCAARLNNEPEVHDYPQKYEVRSKAIESVNTIVLTKYIFYKRGVIVELVIFGNDSVTKTLFKHSFQYKK